MCECTLSAQEQQAAELDMLRHSTAHLMAAAIQQLYPGTHFGVGPAIEDGFYYDVQLPGDHKLSTDDLETIEATMRQIAKQNLPLTRTEVTREEAAAQFVEQPFKEELIAELPEGETITTYTLGDFIDLCRGPHVNYTSKLKHFKLTKVAGAYWRADAEREQLQRIYGTAFKTADELTSYLTFIEEAEKRDHRKLGKELDLFSFNELAGPGLPLYHPKGTRTLRLLQDWLRKELIARDYVEVITPHIYKSDMWKMSGHYDHYKDDMFFFQVEEGKDAEGEARYNEYGVKPMNCPGHLMVYSANLHSYRELPMRIFEFGTVYRNEMSGVVHGLMRARGFTQDDAHILVRPDQVHDEVLKLLDLVDYVMSTFGFSYTAELSTRPEDSIGTDEMWELATSALRDALETRGIDYEINEGDGAFYGPKIDIKLRDAIGRIWQCSTIQFDGNMPGLFGAEYRTAENTSETPYMLHRAILGSMERFYGILLEHYNGALPTWLMPTQAMVIPISEDQNEAARGVATELAAAGLRVEVDEANERMNAKIARAQTQRIPYMLVLGKREAESGEVSVRHRAEGDLGAMPVAAVADKILAEHP
ncbi:MAG: threonine--tRNA ligase [Coriobacteriia bacterium]|nr:threonine--tRNA ligase [Coriobacteriia bacterium]